MNKMELEAIRAEIQRKLEELQSLANKASDSSSGIVSKDFDLLAGDICNARAGALVLSSTIRYGVSIRST